MVALDINKAVKRNMEKFPEEFYFQLKNDEYKNLKFHFGTSSSKNGYGGVRKMPCVFTEQGVAMLASVLRTQVVAKEYKSLSRGVLFSIN